MNIIKDSFKIYFQNIGPLLILSLTIVLPILLLHTAYVNYIYAITSSFASTYIGDFVNAFLVIMLLMLAQLPFIQFVHSDMEGEEKPLKKAYITLFKYGFSVYVFGAVYAFLSVIGLAFFIIPGIVIIVLFFLTPYLSVIREETAWKSFRLAFKYGKLNFFSLFLLILLTSMSELLISIVSLYGVTLITPSYLAVVCSQILLNIILLPYFVCIITLYTKNLKNGLVQAKKFSEFAEG
jgi:hypothetical protein